MSVSVSRTMTMAIRDCREIVKLATCRWHTVAVKLSMTVTMTVILAVAVIMNVAVVAAMTVTVALTVTGCHEDMKLASCWWHIMTMIVAVAIILTVAVRG